MYIVPFTLFTLLLFVHATDNLENLSLDDLETLAESPQQIFTGFLRSNKMSLKDLEKMAESEQLGEAPLTHSQQHHRHHRHHRHHGHRDHTNEEKKIIQDIKDDLEKLREFRHRTGHEAERNFPMFNEQGRDGGASYSGVSNPVPKWDVSFNPVGVSNDNSNDNSMWRNIVHSHKDGSSRSGGIFIP